MFVSYEYHVSESLHIKRVYVVLLFLSFEYIGKGTSQYYRLSNQSKPLEDWSRNDACELADIGMIRSHKNDFQYSPVNMWIKQYKTWINFIGCFKRNSRQLNFGIVAKKEHKDLRIETCLVHCNLSAFVLTREKCICRHQVVLNKTANGHCSVDLCPNDENALCPKNGDHDYVCEYEPVSTSTDVGDHGDCMVVDFKKMEYGFPENRSENCSIKHPYMFKQGNQYKLQRQQLSWKEAARQCSNSRTPVLYSPTVRKSIIKMADSTFWIGAFRRPLFNKQKSLCLSISFINGTSSTRMTNCRESLPALCRTTDQDFIRAEANLTANDNVQHNLQTVTTDIETNPSLKPTKYLIYSKQDKRNFPTVIVASSVGGGVLLSLFIGSVAFCKKKKCNTIKSKSFRNDTDSDAPITNDNNERIPHKNKMDAVYCEICEILSAKHPKQNNESSTVRKINFVDKTYDTLLNTNNHVSELYETLNDVLNLAMNQELPLTELQH